MSKVSKTWKFVLNNWTADDRKRFESLDVNVIVFGEEVGEQGTPHLQGHITFKRSYRLSALKKICDRTHWEVAMCSDFNYELKGENVFIKDNRKQGKRTDIEEMRAMVETGASETEVGKAFPGLYIRYYRGIREYIKLFENKTMNSSYDLDSCCKHLDVKPLEFNSKTEVVIGPSGCGKTQYALSHFKNPLVCSHMDDLKDFKKDFHDGIVFDDMDFTHMPRVGQIHLTDWDLDRSIHCRFNCGFIPRHTKKVITCNYHPFMFDQAIDRRINVSEVSGR